MSEVPDSNTRLLTAKSVGERTDLSTRAVYRLVDAGILPVIRIGEKQGGIRIRERDLLAWLDGAEAVAA